jgi:mRNA-degrading endonuclease RelE of RelBE toxin-antitoxin system
VRHWRIIFLRKSNVIVFVETSIFTRQVQSLLSNEEYRQLQMALVLHPDMGVVIQSSGGLRKVRWALTGRGKRGGVRVIYYWAVTYDRILMLFMYAKNEQDDLTPEQLKVLRRIIEEEYP